MSAAPLKPFFSYFGAKHRIARRYPPPRYDVIIEPFAGSAAYACKYPDKQIVLVDRSPVIAGLWRWLTRVSADEILALPLMNERRQNIDTLNICTPARWLIGFWCNKGHATPCKQITTTWGTRYPAQFWHEQMRARVAAQVARIRHWRVLESSYTDLPNIRATWFVDPPYTGRTRSAGGGGARRPVGDRYPFGTKQIDFAHLSTWCRERGGQTIACEHVGANWLPFEPFHVAKGNIAGGECHEAIWTGENS